MTDDEHWDAILRGVRVVYTRDPLGFRALEALVQRLRSHGSRELGLPNKSVGWLNYPVPGRDGCIFVSIANVEDFTFMVTIARGAALDDVRSRIVDLDSIAGEILLAQQEARRVLPRRRSPDR